MVDTFIDTLLKHLGDLIEPKSAEAKVIAGDEAAAYMLSKAMDPRSSDPDAAITRAVYSTAHKARESVTVFASPNDLPKGPGGRYVQGVYSPKDATIHIDTAMPGAMATLRHELGHFLHIAPYYTPDWTASQGPHASAPKVQGLDIEQIAQFIGGNYAAYNRYGESEPTDFSTEQLLMLLRAIYGTDLPFDREPQ